MSTISHPQTAVILDFAVYRARKAERERNAAGATRRFLWGWPSTGQMMLVDFGGMAFNGRATRSGSESAQAPRG
jgi:hypothetical protein